jgi:thymidylate synthase ThyX
VQQLLRERGETNIPPEDSLRVAEAIKEDFSYVCPDIVKEFKKYDQEPDKHFKKYDGLHTVTGRVSDPWQEGICGILIASLGRTILSTLALNGSWPLKSSSILKLQAQTS